MGTYYDLTAAQNLMSLQQRFNVHRQCNNICTTVLFDKEIDFDILRKAIAIEYERNDALHLRITKQDKKEKQYFADNALQEITFLDFTGKTREEMDNEFLKIARKRITYYDKPLSKIYLVKSYDGKSGMCLLNGHIIMDSWGVTVFYKDLFEVYEALLEGSDMPKPLSSYEKLLQKELDYPNTPRFKSDLDFWKSEIDTDEPIYTDINGSGFLESYRKKKKKPELRYVSNVGIFYKSGMLMYLLPKEIVEKAEKYCIDNQLSLQHMFFLAYRSYLSKVNNREKDILINASAARRGTLEEKNCGGSRVNAINFRSILDENTTFKEGLEIMKEKQTSYYRHIDFDYVEITKMLKKRHGIGLVGGYCSSMLTYQPVKTVSGDAPVYTNWYDNAGYPSILYLTVMDGDGTGALKCYYQYRRKRVSEDTIKNLHNYLCSFFTAGIENDRITIGELLDLK